MSVAASVAQSKERHPENYCPVKRCLWRTGGGYCPRHALQSVMTAQDIKRVEDEFGCLAHSVNDCPLCAELTPSETQAIKEAIQKEDENGK